MISGLRKSDYGRQNVLGLYWLIGPFFYGSFQNLIHSSRNSASKMSHWTVVWPNGWGSKEWCIEPHDDWQVNKWGAPGLQQCSRSTTKGWAFLNSKPSYNELPQDPGTTNYREPKGRSWHKSKRVFLQVWHERGVPKSGWWLRGWTCSLQRCYSTRFDFNQRSSQSMVPFYGL